MASATLVGPFWKIVEMGIGRGSQVFAHYSECPALAHATVGDRVEVYLQEDRLPGMRKAHTQGPTLKGPHLLFPATL